MECTESTKSSAGDARAIRSLTTDEVVDADAASPTVPDSNSSASSPSCTRHHPSSTTLTYRTLLASFPQGRTQWWQQHTLALSRSQLLRTSIAERIRSLRTSKIERGAELDYRQRVFIQSASGVPEPYYLNWTLWAAWLGQIEKLITVAKKQDGWLRLLEDEYVNAVGMWEQFWGFVESDEASVDGEQGVSNKSRQCNEDAHVDIHHYEEENKDDNIANSKNEAGEITNAAKDYDPNGSPSRDLVNQSLDASPPSLTTESNKTPTHSPDSQDQTFPDQHLDHQENHKDSKTTLYEVLQNLSAFNKKKVYLQAKILEANASVELRAFWGEGEPEWIDWGFCAGR